jgi:Fur family ferric uptake transcriptional regulator
LRLHLNRKLVRAYCEDGDKVPETVKSQFVNYLKSKGLLLTRQRARVLEEIARTRGHFGAEDLYLRLCAGEERVSRATVYRALDLLVGAGVVEKLRLGEDQYRFEVSKEGAHHDHLICVRCGHVIEFFSEKIEGLQDEICRGMSFTPGGHSLVIYGLCLRCGELAADESLGD